MDPRKRATRRTVFAPRATLFCAAFLLLLPAPAPAPARAADDEDRPGYSMDYGPFLTGSLDLDPAVSARHTEMSTEQLPDHTNNLAAKSVNVRLRGPVIDGLPVRPEAAIAFDTDLLRYAACWTGGFLNLDKTHLTSEKGSVPLTPLRSPVFATPLRTPGWTLDPAGSFTDPRPRPFGPLPRGVGRYLGLYRHGERVIFRYRVGDADVLDAPALAWGRGRGETRAVTRTLRVAAGDAPLTLLVCDGRHGVGVALVPTDTPAQLRRTESRVTVRVPPRSTPLSFKILITPGQSDAAAAAMADTAEPPEDLDALTRGGPSLWPQDVTTTGQLADARQSDAAYVVDELTLPFDNPWRSWMRPTGFDFFADGKRAALCTWSGDVWVVSGIDDTLKKLTWRRFAAGLYEPLGLRIVNDGIYVRGRDQITRLHDLNADGEADFYENFNHDGVVSANYHGFAFDLHTDAAGNFYYTRVGHRMSPELPGQGALIRVSPDGLKSEVVAGGFRAANGVGVGPAGQLTVADNQGNWTPSSRLNLVRPGGFYGYVPHAHAAGKLPRGYEEDHDPPLCWIPQSLDNSGGAQAWVPPGETRWGPLAGQLLHTSYGTASLLLVLADPDRVDGVPRAAGVVRFPLRFASGVMRARFNDVDGHLYLCGLKGWQTAGPRDGTLCRVRHTGRRPPFPTALRVRPGGLELTFPQPLDPATANDPESFAAQQWNYRWTAEYGSPDVSVTDPTKTGRDDVPVPAATLRDDGRTVFVSIPTLRPVMQLSLRYDLDTAAGTTLTDTLYLTIHHVPN
jgi:glucose/arabinose dehydrogenase